MTFSDAFFVTLLICVAGEPVARILGASLWLYAIVPERRCLVFELFGRVRWVVSEPGLHWPWMQIGPVALLAPLFGAKRIVDLRRDQTYLRSQPVNSEEGAPMGIGIWYEMVVSDPLAYLYENDDPEGSLRANVSNATVRCLSNMKLERMLENRDEMSRAVREEVSSESREWGYEIGSVYIRKVHFRDPGMIAQIEHKVVNRLRQVTAAIQQDGHNRVNVIRATAERESAHELARAATMRPSIVGGALARAAHNPELCRALLDVLETQVILQGKPQVTLIPKNAALLGELLAARKGS
jgi:regulator of protease activity HflC (stomatin/prohibitin superfamily)